MMRIAVRKNARHKKKIAANEKRYPVYHVTTAAGARQIRANDILNFNGEGKENQKGDPDYNIMLSFLDELDDKLDNQNDVDQDKINDIYDFIQRRAKISSDKHLTGDGDLSRDIAAFMQNKANSGSNQGTDVQTLKQDIQNLKNYY